MRFRSLLAGFTAVMMCAPAASALSCMRPDIAQTMEKVKASDEIYYILVGTFNSTPVPKSKATSSGKTGSPNAPVRAINGIGPHNVQAWFDGRILSNDARYDSPVSHMPIDVAVSCAGPWCGSAPANERKVIAFVKARPSQSMLLEAGPCPDKVHSVDDGKIAKLRSCFDQTCVSDTRFDRR